MSTCQIFHEFLGFPVHVLGHVNLADGGTPALQGLQCLQGPSQKVVIVISKKYKEIIPKFNKPTIQVVILISINNPQMGVNNKPTIFPPHVCTISASHSLHPGILQAVGRHSDHLQALDLRDRRQGRRGQLVVTQHQLTHLERGNDGNLMGIYM